MFRVTIEEVTATLESPDITMVGSNRVTGELVVERFRQTVDALDVPRIVALINTKPRAKRGPNKAKAVQS